MATEVKDEAVSAAFAERFLGMLNDSAMILMTSIGHQTGLFDRMEELPPSSGAGIAEAAGLDERYVREWLGAMVTGGFVIYDPEQRLYALPPEHAAWLTRQAGIDNLALQAQYVPLMAEVEQPVIEAFRHGGGVPYSRYPRFHKLMAEDSGAVHDAALLDVILPLVPNAIERLEAGIEVADIGCGSGHAVNLMARRFPRSHFTGFDFSSEAIATARRGAAEWDLDNAIFEECDVSKLDITERFDLITAFDAIHDQAHPAAVLSRISTALKRDGTFLMVDIAASSEVHENIDHLLGPFLYTISCMHCMTVSLALDGEGLGTVWGRQKAEEMLGEAGFTTVDVKNVEGDLVNNYYVARKA